MERRRTLNTILAERSGLTLKRIQSLTCKDTYLEPSKRSTSASPLASSNPESEL
ncbi:MAG: hypothetical protein ACLTSX_02400 [Collinsella sp.]